MPHRTATLLWRAFLAATLVCAVGLLPWLSRTDPALTVLKARSAERDPDPEVLATVRTQLGLDNGPLHLLGQWLGGLPRGDAGRSWISGAEVMPGVLQALGASLLLMGAAVAVAVVTAGLVCARTLRRGARAVGRPGDGGPGFPGTLGEFVARRLGGTGSAARSESRLRRRFRRPAERPGGTGSAVLAALPEFLTASVLATVVGVQLGRLPALGWYGPRWVVLPALALGVPAGAVLGRLLDDLLPGAFGEPWVRAAAARGLSGGVSPDRPCGGVCPGCCPTWVCSSSG